MTNGRPILAVTLALLLAAVTLDAPARTSADAPPSGPPGVIQTIAGGGTTVMRPYRLLVDQSDALIVDDSGTYIYKITNAGVIPIAGTLGVSSGIGDGGPATAATIALSYGIATDSAANLYIGELFGCRVRRVDATSGVISTVVGTRCRATVWPEDWVDGSPAIQTPLFSVGPVAVDNAGDLYIGDYCRIVKVSGGVITSVAGATSQSSSCTDDGDGGSALSAHIQELIAMAVAANGDIYFTSNAGCRIRKISGGVITTVAGDGVCGFNGDGPATAVHVSAGYMTVDALGTVFIAEQGVCRVRAVRDGFISTVAGMGSVYPNGCGTSGDGGPANAARLGVLSDVALDSAGNLYVGEFTSDYTNGRIRIVYGADRDSDGDGYTDAQEGNLAKDPQQYCDLMRADANGDGVVNSIDLLVVAKAGQRWPRVLRMDQNGDGRVNALDLLIVAKRQNRSVSGCL